MMFFNQKTNQQGSISIVFAMFVTGLFSIILMQISSSNSVVNGMHSVQKNWFDNSQNIMNLALQFKQSYNMGQVDANCSSFQNTVSRNIGGVNFCLQNANSICVSTGNDPRNSQTYCASMDESSLIWPGHISPSNQNQNPISNARRSLAGLFSTDGASSSSSAKQDSGQGTKFETSNRRFDSEIYTTVFPQKRILKPQKITSADIATSNNISVPPRNQNLWVTCGGSGLCLQVNLCKQGLVNCTKETAVATQVIRLGSLN